MIERASLSATDFARLHYKTPALVEHGIRCGKSNCTCATGAYRHGPYAYLYWRDDGGYAHRRYVPKAEVAAVREIVQSRQASAREWRQTLRASRLYLRELRAWVRELEQIGKGHGLW